MRSPALLLLLAATGLAVAQTASDTPAPPTSDPRAILHAAVPLYDFQDASLHPFHLKATYQLYAPEGKPTEQGTWEYWWASPKVHRETVTSSDASRTTWSTATGRQMRQESGGPLHYFERNIYSYVVDPLPRRDLIDSNRMKLGLKKVSIAGLQLDCLTMQQLWSMNGKLKVPASSTPEEYCFDPAIMALRLKSSNRFISEFNDLVNLNGRELARKVSVIYGKQSAFSVTIDEISDLDPHSEVLNPPADAEIVSTADPENADSNVAAGMLMKRVPPTYPFTAKARRIQGTVILAAVIGKDGKLRDLEVLSSPAPVLAEAALDAVKHWEYRPYLLNGAPVEVESLINVVFSLGG